MAGRADLRLQAVTTGTVLQGARSGDRSVRPFTLYAAGTWGGGTLTLQVGFTNLVGVVTWIPVAGVSLTANGMASFDHRFEQIRAVLAGGAGPYDIHVSLMY